MKKRYIFYVVLLLIIFLLALILIVSLKSNQQINMNEKLNDIKIPSEYETLYYGGYGGSGHGSYFNLLFKIQNESEISCDGELTGYGMVENGFRDYKKNCSNETNIYTSYNETISAKIDEIKKLNFSLAYTKNINGKECILNLTGGDPIMRGFCFKDNILVNYWGRWGYGGNKFDWNVKGYELSPSEMQEIPELKDNRL